VNDKMLDAIGALGATRRSRDCALANAGEVAAQSDRLRRQLAPFKSSARTSPVPYPKHESDFPERLAGLAAMLAAGMPLRVVALNAFGMYDTHSDQPDQLAEGLKVTSESLLAFQRDLEARGLADRVITLVWSEFGRRAAENGSNGTDHGAAGTALLIGSRVRGGFLGELPALKGGLDNHGNLRATVDFRSVYCSLLEQWLGADAGGVIPNARAYQRVGLLK
jgi:uncharacterized protein (DUF1501 family)